MISQETDSRYFLEWSHYGIADGISHTQVSQTFQDGRGLLWLVTQNGLNVFDGHKAINVNSWPSLLSTKVIRIRAEDHRKIIWMRYSDAQELWFKLFDTRTRAEVPLYNRVDTMQTGVPVDVSTYPDGLLLLINSKGELWKENTNGTWTKLATDLGHYRTFCGGVQHRDAVWVSTEKTYKEPEEIEVVSIASNGNSGKTIKLEDYSASSITGDGRLWVQCGEKIGFLSSSGPIDWIPLAKIFKQRVVAGYFYSKFDPAAQIIWIWNNDELTAIECLFNGSQVRTKILCTVNVKAVPFGIDSGCNGSIFISSGDGVYCPTLTKTNFRKIFWSDDSHTSKLEMREARGMIEWANGTVYMLVGNYLYSYDTRTGATRGVYPYQVGISYLLEDPVRKSLWFGTLFGYQPDKNTVTNYPFLLEGDWGVTWSAALLHQNKLLLGTSEGLIIFDCLNNSFTRFKDYNSFTELEGSGVYYIHEEQPGEWWLLADNGLYIMTEKSGIIAKYGSGQSGRNYLPAENFRHYYKDQHGIYWLATGSGLVKWNRSAGTADLITTEQGLSNNNLYAVYADRSGFLWISSDYGIIQYHLESGAVRYFLVKDGVSNNEFNRISHLQTKDGAIFMGGINGVTSFHPDDFKYDIDAREYPGLVVTSIGLFMSNDKKQEDLLGNYYKDNKITVGPGNMLLNIEFSMPNYQKDKGVSYSYMIEGLNQKWIHTVSPLIQLVGLAPGEYTLVIMARAGSGAISGEPCRVLIEVMPRFYQKSWFWAVCAAFLFVLIRMTWRYREKLLVDRQKELEETVARSTEKIIKDKELIEKQAALLKDRNIARNRFFANITHEFRTPLSLVMGPLDVVRKQSGLSRRYRSLLDIALGNSKRLLDLVDSILMMSTLDANRFQRRDEHVEIEEIARTITEGYAVLADQKGINLYIDCSVDENTRIVTDVRVMKIIMNNLMSNALKYTPPEGKIYVSIRNDDQRLFLTVTDTGRGIHPEDLPYIFDRYFQTSRPEAPLEGGTGIGLALVKELTEMMNGSVTVESNPDGGSQFTVMLPLGYSKSESLSIIQEIPDKSDNSLSSRKRKSRYAILLVEDNPDFQQYISFVLNEFYQVTVASNGSEALEMLKSGLAPDLVVTDWMMPEMDGLQLTRALRELPRLASIPVLFLTARSASRDKEQAIRLGIDDYLSKPIAETEFISAINRLIERSQIRKTEIEEDETTTGEDVARQEAQWLENLQEATINNMSDELFSVDQLASIMLMGRTSFYKEVKKLTGLTPNEYILEARLLKARSILESHPEMTVKKVVKMIGLKDEGHFSKAFNKRFGNPPSWYL